MSISLIDNAISMLVGPVTSGTIPAVLEVLRTYRERYDIEQSELVPFDYEAAKANPERVVFDNPNQRLVRLLFVPEFDKPIIAVVQHRITRTMSFAHFNTDGTSDNFAVLLRMKKEVGV
jgi:hypothetical protein